MNRQKELEQIQEKLIFHTNYILEGGIPGEDEPVAGLVNAIVNLENLLRGSSSPTVEEKTETVAADKNTGPLDWMRQIRIEKKLKQSDLASLAGTSQWVISQLERGLQPPKDKEVTKKVSLVLGVDEAKFNEHSYILGD